MSFLSQGLKEAKSVEKKRDIAPFSPSFRQESICEEAYKLKFDKTLVESIEWFGNR